MFNSRKPPFDKSQSSQELGQRDPFDREPRLFNEGESFSQQDSSLFSRQSSQNPYPQDERKGPCLVATNDFSQGAFERQPTTEEVPFDSNRYPRGQDPYAFQEPSYEPSGRYEKQGPQSSYDSRQNFFKNQSYYPQESEQQPLYTSQREPAFGKDSYQDYERQEYAPRDSLREGVRPSPRAFGTAYPNQDAPSPQDPTFQSNSRHFWPESSTDQGDYEEDYEEENWQEEDSKGPMRYVLAIAILVIVTVLGWFGFRWLTGNSSSYPPLIQAEQGPFKVRPDNPGGMLIPHQDKLVYRRLTPGGGNEPAEQLIAPQEEVVISQEQGYLEEAQQGQPLMFVDQNGQIHQVVPQQQGYASVPAYATQQGVSPAYPQELVQNAPAMTAPQQAIPQGGTSYAQQQQGLVQNTVPVQTSPQQAPHGTIPYNQAYPQQPQTQAVAQQQQAAAPLPQSAQSSTLAPQEEEQAGQQGPIVAKTEVVSSKETSKKAQTLDDVMDSSSSDKAQEAPVKSKYRAQIATFKNKSDAENEKNRLLKEKASIFAQTGIDIKKLKEDSYVLLAGSFNTRTLA
ncbi:MAG TPA: hypothetical protein VI959_01145, partial [Alphaproteobacteria bacterium]|nr:hypothetical protein [Alphaproteobacteria bacterium]